MPIIQNNKLLIHDTAKNKYVLAGKVEGKVFIKKVGPKHYMRHVGGYGIQEEVIQLLLVRGINKIKIISPVFTYLSDLKTWLEPNIKVSNYGHGKQRFLPTTYMERK